MNVPKEIQTYCPKCKAHTKQKVKKVVQKKTRATPRNTSWGQIKHEKKTKGYTSRVAGTTKHDKQSQRNVLVLECPKCKKKQQRTVGSRTRKRIETKKGV